MKTGRLLMIGFDGTELPEGFKPLIKKYGMGGFVLFERNIKTTEQILALNKQLHQADEDFIPIIAVDHEGGRVQRLKHPFTRLPSARKIGDLYQKHENIDFIYAYGGFIAEELSMAGFNMALAPVLDLPDKEGGVIGDRAFSDIPLVIEEIGVSMIAGMQDNGIIACAKHFPGHTDTKIDPHKGLPIAHITSEELIHHMTPFIHAIKNRVGSVMVSHTVFKGLENVPASMSQRVMDVLLKKDTGFEGIVITDDVKMAAIAQTITASQAVLSSLHAGADMVMISKVTPDELEDLLKDMETALAEGTLDKGHLESSLVRTDIIKGEIGIKNHPVHTALDVLNMLSDEKHKSFIKRLKREGI